MEEQAAETTETQEQQTTETTEEVTLTSDLTETQTEETTEVKEIEYTDFEVPEGMALDKTAIETFKPLAKELGLNQEQAQKLVDFYKDTIHKRVTDDFEATKAEWLETAKKDPEIGGQDFQKKIGIAQRALKTFASPELETTLAQYGFDRHPEMIRLFYSIGLQIKEDDKFINGNGSGELSEEDRAKQFYSKTYK